MNVVKEWILVGAGLAIGKLIVAVAVIAVLAIIVGVLCVLEEKSE
jgi:hypothetical protein